MRLLLLFLLLPFFLGAQKVEVVRKTDSIFNKVNQGAGFPMIDSALSRTDIRFVATIQARMKKGKTVIDDLIQMISKIEKKAKKFGANSYFISDYILNDSSDMVGLVLDVYRSSAQILPSKPKEELNNILYVFPTFTGYGKKPFTFRFNDDIIDLGYREYFVCHLETGIIVKLAKSPAEKTISVNGGMPCVALAYIPFNPFMNETGKFTELPQKFLPFYFRTFFIHPKTCTNCTIPPAAIPSTSAPQ